MDRLSNTALRYCLALAKTRRTRPFLTDLKQFGPDEAEATTDCYSDGAGWVHAPELLLSFSCLVERVLQPEEEVSELTRMDFRKPITSQARLHVQRRGRVACEMPSVAAEASFETSYGEDIVVRAVLDPSKPLPLERATSGSPLVASSISTFEWGKGVQHLMGVPESMQVDFRASFVVDAAFVLLANAAVRSIFPNDRRDVLISSVRDFEIPSRDLLLRPGGRIVSSVRMEQARVSKRGYHLVPVRADFYDDSDTQNGGGECIFAIPQL